VQVLQKSAISSFVNYLVGVTLLVKSKYFRKCDRFARKLFGGRNFLVDSLVSAEIKGRRFLSRDSAMFYLLNRISFSHDVSFSNCLIK
jgi:hypothetical protein